MRRFCILILPLLLLLTACAGREDPGETLALAVRTEYLAAERCSGSAELTADYGQRVYTYGIDFSWEPEGETVLTLTAPDTVAGTTARILAGESALEFDGVRVETGPLTLEGLSPVDAIPALLRAVREGYLAECGMETLDERPCVRMVCRDPSVRAGEGVELHLWADAESHALLRGEISSDGRTVVQCVFGSFVCE